MPVRDLGAAVAAALIESSNGSMSVADLCRSTGWNARKLERLFLEQIGIGPKLFSRITRFQSFLRAVKTDPASPILDAVYDAGYYDQSHMTKDFRQFAGCSPTEYFRNDHEISTILANGD